MHAPVAGLSRQLTEDLTVDNVTLPAGVRCLFVCCCCCCTLCVPYVSVAAAVVAVPSFVRLLLVLACRLL